MKANWCFLARIYFLVLGLFNIMLTLAHGTLGAFDFVIFLVCTLPLLRIKWIQLSFGILAAVLGTVIGISCIAFHADPAAQNPAMDWIMGYFLAASMVIAALILIGSTLSHDKRTFRLV